MLALRGGSTGAEKLAYDHMVFIREIYEPKDKEMNLAYLEGVMTVISSRTEIYICSTSLEK